jgi:hypothetical protein
MANVNDTDVTYFLIARDGTALAHESARSQLKKTEDASEKTAGAMKTHWESFRKHWLEVTASFYAAYKIFQKAWNMAEMAAQFEQQKVAFANMAASYGTTADAIIADLKRVSSGTIDTMTMMEKAGTAMMMGISPEKVVKLMEIARATAKMTGQDVTQAFSDISLAVGRQSKMILDNLGIIVSVEKANEAYAKSVGKTAASLTDAEKKQAFMNATVEAGEELMARLGKQEDTVRDKMDRLKATVKDIELWLGQMTIRAAMGAMAAFQGIAASVLLLYGGLKGLQGLYSKEAQEDAKAAFAAAVDLVGKAKDNLKAMIAPAEALATAMAKATGGKTGEAGGGGKGGKSSVMTDEQLRDLWIAAEAEKYAEAEKFNEKWLEDEAKARQKDYEAKKKADEEDIKRILEKNEADAQLSQAQYEALRAIEDAYLEEKRQKEEKAAQAEMNLKYEVVNNAAALLMMLGEKQKAAAALGIALSTAMEIARAWQTTIAASTLAFASQLVPGDPTSLARATAAAAAVKAWGAVNIALIAAAGALRIGATMSGGGGEMGAISGGGYNPNSNVETTYARNQELKSPKVINVHIYGNVVDNDKFARELIESIRKAEEDNVH